MVDSHRRYLRVLVMNLRLFGVEGLLVNGENSRCGGGVWRSSQPTENSP